ncbi:MAG: N-acetylmuramoyl-L-alanine amidase [Alphaproteobacteria bacterium]|nr:N-acetylmuramoyl-L-alanine amidase [Alphaproteobacteria bacterium]MDE2337300.1 N-acetylmuramoyl-L-alanine amidase [Alphaproteobacteria bacterium]
MNVIDAPSPNFGPRPEGKKIKYLILHYTGTETSYEALRLLQGGDKDHEVSAHYMVDEDGSVMRLVDESLRAWHAGKSYWEGETDINSCSIGIEIQNAGHDFGLPGFPDTQIAAVIELCREIMARHKILPCHVLGHSDVAPGRKKDPGEKFPWQKLAEAGIGAWPESGESEEADIDKILTQFGYDPNAELKARITEFQRHFMPEIFATKEKIGVADPDTVQKLQSLVKKKLGLRPKAPGHRPK